MDGWNTSLTEAHIISLCGSSELEMYMCYTKLTRLHEPTQRQTVAYLILEHQVGKLWTAADRKPAAVCRSLDALFQMIICGQMSLMCLEYHVPESV